MIKYFIKTSKNIIVIVVLWVRLVARSNINKLKIGTIPSRSKIKMNKIIMRVY